MNSIQTNQTLTMSQVETILAAWLGSPVACTRIQPLHGGMINTVLRLEFDRPPFNAVIKLSPGNGAAGAIPADLAYATGGGLQAEARALDYLRAHTRFPSPRVYLLDTSASLIPHAFLLIETIPGACLSGLELSPAEYDDLDRQLARVLLELHSHTRDRFGGIDGQPGSQRWTDVFLPRLRAVRAQPEIGERLPRCVLDEVDRAIDLAEGGLRDQGLPTLIHGDIWSGNLLVERAGSGWRLSGIVDPGIYYADIEAELSYLEVFNTRRAAFFAEYTAGRALRPGYERRRWFYWLHTALIHVYFFGDRHYRDFTAQAAAAICRDHLSG